MMMKKLIVIAIILQFAVPLQAKDGDQVTLQAGTANTIWTLGSAYFETMFSEASVEGVAWEQWLQKQGADYVRDWPSDKLKIEAFFMERFNKKTKRKGGLNLQNSNPNDAYRFVIHFSDIDMGSIGGGVAASVFLGGFARKSGGVNFKSGYVDIVEVTTGKVVCRLAFNDVRGDSGLNMTSQLILALEDLHDELIGFAERFSNKQMPETMVEAISSTPQQITVLQQAPTNTSVPLPSASPQGQQVKVKLKTGTTITGILKSFDPLTQIVIVIAGHETSVPMASVENVEMVQNTVSESPQPVVVPQYTTAPQPVKAANANASLGNRKLLVTETPDKPERITINIGHTTVEMVLVNGGRMNMGYDGDGSRRMRSEPVHEVEVTSFYMSVQPLPASLVLPVVGDKNVDGKGNEPAQVRSFDDVEKVLASIVSQTGYNLRLPTEAEWEYAASCDKQNLIFSIAAGSDVAYEWCSDFLDWFPKERVVMTDPTGPLRGEQHVIRAFNGDRGKYDRSSDIDEDDAYLGLIRLVIKAKDIK